MVCGKGSLFVIGTLLLICCMLLEQTEGRGATRPSPQVGKKLRAARAQLLATARGNKKRNGPMPYEYGAGIYKEMDIMEKEPRQLNGVALSVNPNSRWPNAVVPYVVTGTFSDAEKTVIQAGMTEIASKTCVKFVARTTEAEYVTIGNSETGCWAYVGRSMQNSENQVNLQNPECMTVGTVVHELMHAIGFHHEFSRPDRDEYVSIDRTALATEYQTDKFFNENYAKMAASDVDLYGRPYDYGSVMHYSKYAAAASNTRPVMNNLKPWTGDFGNEQGLSADDIVDINSMYCTGTG